MEKKTNLIARAISIAEVLLVLAIAFDLFNPRGGMPKVTVLGALAMLHFLNAFNKPGDSKTPTLKGLPSFAMAIACIGVLYCTNLWLNGQFFLTAGILACMAAFLVTILIKNPEQKPSVATKRRVAVYGLLCCLLLVLPAFTYQKIKFRNQPQLLHALIRNAEHHSKASADSVFLEFKKLDGK